MWRLRPWTSALRGLTPLRWRKWLRWRHGSRHRVPSWRVSGLKPCALGSNRERDSVNTFWEEVKKAGAPMIEPIAGDRENMAVTFLWKSKPDTQNVIVLWLPYVGVAPDEFLMTRLGETNVWYKTIKVDRKMRLAYTLAPNAARLRPLSLGIDNEAITMTAAAARPDPLNPKRYRVDPKSVDAAEYRGNSVLEMPGAPPHPWLDARPGVPGGRIEKHRFKSAALNNEREIAIYLPPTYSPRAEPYPLLVLFDEDAYLSLVPTPTILDNLISEGRIPPVIALLVGNAKDDARDRELLCNPGFMGALVTEVLPWAHGLYNFTRDPRQTVVAGSSLGGLAAACAGLWHPETFGNVLSQSGAFHRRHHRQRCRGIQLGTKLARPPDHLQPQEAAALLPGRWECGIQCYWRG